MSRFAVQPNHNSNAIIELITNAELYKGRLAEFEDAKKALDEKIALAGAADQIMVLHADATKLHQAAQDHSNAVDAQCAAKLEACHQNIVQLEAQAKARIEAELSASRAACLAREQEAGRILEAAKQNAANSEQVYQARKLAHDNLLKEAAVMLLEQSNQVNSALFACKSQLEANQQKLTSI